MNITEYLAEYLKQGKDVEIPNIGRLATKEVEAYMDADKATFYPYHRVVFIERNSRCESDFVALLAKKECVERKTAERIWKNYCDALNAKIEKEGSCKLGDLGCIVKEDGACRFEMDDNALLSDSAQHMQPVTGIRHYQPTDDTDPFAAYEQPLKEIVEEQEPMPESEPIPEPEPTPEPMPEPEPELEPEPEPISAIEPEEETIPEHEAEVEPEPEPEEIPEPMPELEPEPEPEELPEPEPEEKPADSSSVAFDDAISTLQQLDAIEESNNNEEEKPKHKKSKKAKKAKNDKKDKGDKKKGGFWKALLWILAILLVLLACAAVIDRYLFNSQGRDWLMQKVNIERGHKAIDENEFSAAIVTGDEEEVGNVGFYTFSSEGLQFDENEIDAQSHKIVDRMSNYFTRFLKDLKQSENEDVFVEQVEHFCKLRLTELLDDKAFHPQSLLTYKDYVRDAYMPYLKQRQIDFKSWTIYKELMNQETLERLLSEVVPADELTPDPEEIAAEQKKAAEAAKKKAAAAKPAATKSHVATASKQGFDLIAGFSVNKSNADRLCSQLKGKGCDAYIINRNGLYYVSMGSAASRTEIEAKYTHVKEWYKGDVSIKKW